MENKVYEFDAELKLHEDMNAAYVEFPFDCQKEFGKKGQVKIQATIDGVEYRGSLAKMKTDCHILGVLKEIRAKINKREGDTVHIILEEDRAERIVIIPDDLQARFDEYPLAKKVFDKMSYTHRKEYVNAINDAKKPETRLKRLDKTIEMLLSKIK